MPTASLALETPGSATPPAMASRPPASSATIGPTDSPVPASATPLPSLPPGPIADALRQQLDAALMAQQEQRRIPGMNAEVIFPDGSRWSAASGLADIDRNLPATRDTTFVVGSITKTFVTAAVMELKEDGDLSIDDPLSDWLPSFPNAQNITLAQLMSHTSGLFDYFQHADYNLRVFNEPDHAWTPEEILSDFSRKPYCDPGACYQYSNTNFVLLGMVLEEETGKELSDVLRERFFDPLELDETFSQCEAPPPSGSARGYLVRPERAVGLDDGTDYRPTKSAATVACAAGDIVSTSTDLADWARALYGGDLLEPDSLALMTAYTDYPGESYGMGTRTRVVEGVRLFGHTGSLRGFDAAMWHAPEVDLTMVVLTNRGRIDANPIIDALAAVAVPYAEADRLAN
jgi:D-alanyl-D-alanine carboxypeptidase